MSAINQIESNTSSKQTNKKKKKTSFWFLPNEQQLEVDGG